VRCRSFGGATVELIGTFGGGDGQFSLASGVATDGAGNVYVADTQNHRVQKLTGDGVFLAKWGSFGTGNGQFNEPAAIAVDAAGNVYVVDQVNRRVQKFTSSGVYLTQWGSLGSGNGQFDFPTGIAIDPNGIVYVAEGGNARVQKFTGDGTYIGQWAMPLGATPDDITVDRLGNVYVPTGTGGHVFRFTTNGLLLNVINLGPGATSVPSSVGVDAAGSVYIGEGATTRVLKFVTSPSIAFSKDVPADEGGRVTLRIRPASADSPNSGLTVLGYDVYLLSQSLAAPGGAEGTKLNAYLVPATGAAAYSVEVATLDDATAAALEHGMFMVRAWTGPYSYSDSELHPAMSVDNLAPPVPSPFVVKYAGGSAHLHWDVNPAADFEAFRLHRGFDPAFVPGPGTLLTSTPDTGYVDNAQPGFTYKLSAVDVHGNESLFAVLGPSGIVGVPGEAAAALAFGLEPVRPNPIAAGRSLTVRFTLARAGEARLELVDVAGRRVARREVGELGAGAHAVDLLAGAGGRATRAGVYFVRLAQGGDEAVRRVVVLE
jgi:streptogramin lyase